MAERIVDLTINAVVLAAALAIGWTLGPIIPLPF